MIVVFVEVERIHIALPEICQLKADAWLLPIRKSFAVRVRRDHQAGKRGARVARSSGRGA